MLIKLTQWQHQRIQDAENIVNQAIAQRAIVVSTIISGICDPSGLGGRQISLQPDGIHISDPEPPADIIPKPQLVTDEKKEG